MIAENRLKHTIFILLEGRSYSHLFGDNSSYQKLENSQAEFWPEQVLTGSFKNEIVYKQAHTQQTLPIIKTLFNEYASIPHLELNNEQDDVYETLQNIFGPQANFLDEIDSKVYAHNPSLMQILNENITPHEFEQFFVDLNSDELPLLSIIESNTYLDGEGWSMATGGNSLNYAEYKILNIVREVQKSKFSNNSHIFLLWVDDGGLPDTTINKRLANIWISPYFLPGKRIFDYENMKITTKSLYNFLQKQYRGISHDKMLGTLWQKNLLNEIPLPSKKLENVNPNSIQYQMGVSPFKLGHPSRIKGTTELLFQRKNRKNKNIDVCYKNAQPAKIELKDAIDDENDKNSTIGFWLLFSAVILYVLLILGLLYVYIIKHAPSRMSHVTSFTSRY